MLSENNILFRGLKLNITDINKFDYFDNKIKINFDNYLDLIIWENYNQGLEMWNNDYPL